MQTFLALPFALCYVLFTSVVSARLDTILSSKGVLNVLDFGAVGDNKTDETASFLRALAAADASGGGIVYVPPGLYRINGYLSLGKGVRLQGTYGSVPSHDLRGGSRPDDGSILIPLAGRGSENDDAFISLQQNSHLSGFCIWYAEQEMVQTPVAYPWTIHMTAANAAVTDVEVLGSWQAINATAAHRHYIARVQGHPIKTGIFVDSTYDIGRIEDVHFNPWFSSAHPFIEYQLVNGRAFVLGRSDWEYVLNTFAFGYAIGYHFINTPTGQMNGNFLGIGADLSVNASVQVDASQAPGKYSPSYRVISLQLVLSSFFPSLCSFLRLFRSPSSKVF